MQGNANIPRRKSCMACFRAKRRCDLTHPRCMRCRSKGLTCEFATTADQYAAKDTASTPTGDLVEPFTALYPLSNDRSSAGSFVEGIAQDQFGYSNADILEFLELQTLQVMTPPSLSPNHDIKLGAVATTAMAAEVFRQCVREISTYPDMFVRYGHTPFIHNHLYYEETPKPVRDAYSACATYLSKSPTNEKIVNQVLDSAVLDLLELPTFATVADNLAGVQALILLQIIRLFDGDIRQRAMAEQQAVILDLWTEQLRNYATSEVYDPWTPWQLWVFDESLRRTVLMSGAADVLAAVDSLGQRVGSGMANGATVP